MGLWEEEPQLKFCLDQTGLGRHVCEALFQLLIDVGGLAHWGCYSSLGKWSWAV